MGNFVRRMKSTEVGYRRIMEPRSTHPRWRRRIHVRREVLRRNLAVSAALGIGGGIAGLVLVHGDAGSDIVPLVRLAMMLPAIVFVAWWMTGPGLIIDPASEAQAPVTDPEQLAERMRAVEHVFDDVAVPAAKRVAHDDEREWFRASIRRDLPNEAAAEDSWGLPRRAPVAPSEPPRAADQA